ncbi:midasin [Dorcoceras hygrometricum]|uniref:Midasin n=1 Tax=Dorcoceras hygrometricum TaxID=472368 RepID=A0A2Z7CB51_9LAMI|nr:midasin [Dorcoceras hygrometricum]
MHFTADDIPLDEETQISMRTAIVSSHDYADAFAQLRATVYQISIEKVQTRFHLDKLKVELLKKISNLENAFLTESDNQYRVVLAQTNVLRKEMKAQKDALYKELDAMRKEVQDQKAAFVHDILEFRMESLQNIHTLSAQFSEHIAYINIGRDDKKGEVSSSRGPQPPDDRSRPGSGGGSKSDPSRKRGSGYRGGGSTSSRGFRYCLGE